MRNGLIAHVEKCTGCRACEIACSFHHERIFSPTISSIEIHRDLEKGKMAITIYDRKVGTHHACDECEGEKEPLCVKYCTTKAITVARREKS
jgi:Fe-S-cluster-containing hydrogenase component 2